MVGSWQLYITVGLGEAEPFFAGPMAQNSRLDEMGVRAFAASGLASAWHLLTWTLPRKVSWTALALAAEAQPRIVRRVLDEDRDVIPTNAIEKIKPGQTSDSHRMVIYFAEESYEWKSKDGSSNLLKEVSL